MERLPVRQLARHWALYSHFFAGPHPATTLSPTTSSSSILVTSRHDTSVSVRYFNKSTQANQPKEFLAITSGNILIQCGKIKESLVKLEEIQKFGAPKGAREKYKKFKVETSLRINNEVLQSDGLVGGGEAEVIEKSINIGDKISIKVKNYKSNDYDGSKCDDGDSRWFRNDIVYILGVLGLFKGMTTNDLEEEKAKLTDEEKVKKMKPAELLIAKGVLSLCDQDYSKANELFHKALHIAQDENNEEQETLVLNLLASSYFESGDLENAEKLFIDLMKRMIANEVEPTDPAILELSLKLASIYSRNTRTHGKAMKGFRFVIDSLVSNLQDTLNNVDDLLENHELSEDKKNELALLGWSYDWFAKHLLAINDYRGAADMLQQALDISSKVLGPLHDQTLILMNDVGTTLAMNNLPERGKTFIQKAVEGAIESQSKEMASFYVNLGLVNLQLKKLSEAKRYCEYAIELALKNREHHNADEVIKLSRVCLSEVEKLLQVETHQ